MPKNKNIKNNLNHVAQASVEMCFVHTYKRKMGFPQFTYQVRHNFGAKHEEELFFPKTKQPRGGSHCS